MWNIAAALGGDSKKKKQSSTVKKGKFDKYGNDTTVSEDTPPNFKSPNPQYNVTPDAQNFVQTRDGNVEIPPEKPVLPTQTPFNVQNALTPPTQSVKTELPNAPEYTNRDRANYLAYLQTDAAKDNPDNKVSRWRAAVAGGLKGFGRGIAQGGLAQGIYEGLSQGGEYGVNPKLLADENHRAELLRLQPALALEAQQEKQANEERKRLLDEANATEEYKGKIINNAKGEIGYRQAGLDLLKSQNKSLYDSILADDVVTEDEAKMATQAGFPVKPYDARKFTTSEVNGITYATPSLGIPQLKPVLNAPTDKTKVPLVYKSPSGNKFTLNPNQAAQLEAAILNGDANRIQQVILQNNRVENDIIEAQNKASNERESLLAVRDGAMAVANTAAQMIPALEQELNNLKESNPPADNALITQKEAQLQNVRNTYNEANAKATEAEGKYNRYQMPKNQKTIDPNSVPRLNNIPKTTEKEIRQRLKNRPGITEAQIQTAIQAARDKGILK